MVYNEDALLTQLTVIANVLIFKNKVIFYIEGKNI